MSTSDVLDNKLLGNGAEKTSIQTVFINMNNYVDEFLHFFYCI